MFLRFTSKQTYRIFFFLYILFAIHHSLRCWYFLSKVKSGSRKILILLFSRIFVYRCHGNIDFHKMQTTLKFNPKPTSIANFTLIRQDEDCLRADFKSEVWSPKNCIETPYCSFQKSSYLCFILVSELFGALGN